MTPSPLGCAPRAPAPQYIAGVRRAARAGAEIEAVRQGGTTLSEDEVLEANEAFYSAFNQKDMAAMDAAWARSVTVGCIHPGWNVLWGREPVMDSWNRILSNPGQPKVFSGGATVSVLGDMAIVACREIVAGAPLAATNVFIREDDAWKLIHHQSGMVSMPG